MVLVDINIETPTTTATIIDPLKVQSMENRQSVLMESDRSTTLSIEDIKTQNNEEQMHDLHGNLQDSVSNESENTINRMHSQPDSELEPPVDVNPADLQEVDDINSTSRGEMNEEEKENVIKRRGIFPKSAKNAFPQALHAIGIRKKKLVSNMTSMRAEGDSFSSFWRDKLLQTMNHSTDDSSVKSSNAGSRDVFHLLLKLYAHEDIVEELYTSYEANSNEFEFYIPQLCTFLIHGKYTKQHQLECFLMSRSGESLPFAHRLAWFLKSFCNEAKNYQSEYLSVVSSSEHGNAEHTDLLTAICARGGIPALLMSNGLCFEETSIINGDARNIAQRRRLAFDLDLDYTIVATDKSMAVNGSQQSDLPLYSTDESLANHLTKRRNKMAYDALPNEGTKEQVLLFNETPNFVTALTDLATHLISVNSLQRDKELRRGLEDIKIRVFPSDVLYLPVGHCAHRVVNIHVDECFTFSTKERVPYFLCVEVVDYDIISKKKKKYRRRFALKLPFHHKSIEKKSTALELSQDENENVLNSPKNDEFASDSNAEVGVFSEEEMKQDDTNNKSPDSSQASTLNQDIDNPLPHVVKVGKKKKFPVKMPRMRFKKKKRQPEAPRETTPVARLTDSIDCSEGVGLGSLLSPTSAGQKLSEEELKLENNLDEQSNVEEPLKKSKQKKKGWALPSSLPSVKLLNMSSSISSKSADTTRGTNSLDFEDNDVWKAKYGLEEYSSSADESKDGESKVERSNEGELSDSTFEPFLGADDVEDDDGVGTDQFIESQDQTGNALMTTVFKGQWHEKEARLREASEFGSFPGWRLLPVIVKSNDDLRQEQFASQLIAQCDRIFRSYSLPLTLRPYNVIATSPSTGLIEAVPDTVSLDTLRKVDPQYTTLMDFYKRLHSRKTNKYALGFARARRNFVESLAAYCIVCYVFQIKDRHNANILIDSAGHLIHVDFGFLLTNSPGSNLNFEKAPFKLTDEFVELMGGPRSSSFRYFRSLCIRAYLALRRNREKIVLLTEMMMVGNADLPCFAGGAKSVIDGLRERLKPDARTSACQVFVNSLIDESLGNWRTRWYDKYQRAYLGIM